jgi:hypothetical protein
VQGKMRYIVWCLGGDGSARYFIALDRVNSAIKTQPDVLKFLYATVDALSGRELSHV